MKYREIIWDWNGTVVDDVSLCVEVIGELMHESGLKPITVDEYKEKFFFPVSKFYSEMGFNVDEESYADISRRYMDIYNARRYECPLHTGFDKITSLFRDNGLAQNILSAYQRQYLMEAAQFYKVDGIMKNIVGLGDIQAHTKVEAGIGLVKSLNCDPSEILVIGDTDHDHEVAAATGADCVLMEHGHQTKERLGATGRETFVSFQKLAERLFG